MNNYVNIIDLINGLSDTEKEKFNVIVNSIPVLTYNTILDYFKYNYSQFSSIHSKNSTDFSNHFKYFLTCKSYDIDRIYNALSSTYNVLDNYNRIETTNINTSATVQSDINAVSTSYETTENNADFNPVSKNETNGGKTSNSGTSSTETNIHGNIGVTTNQQMLESEILLRMKYNLCKLICDDFARGDFVI